MRNVINISLPTKMVGTVNREVRAGRFASKSEFFRHLLRLWNSRELAAELHERRRDFEAGKGKTLRSLRDLR
jgi:Arc/MetJ-type ribon-helix-helix transcriptional regulator